MNELNSEFHHKLVMYCEKNDEDFFNLIEMFGGKESRKSLVLLFNSCVEEERKNRYEKRYYGNPFDAYRDSLYEFFKSNEDKLSLWTEILNMKML